MIEHSNRRENEFDLFLQKAVEVNLIFEFGCPYGPIFWFEMNVIYEWSNRYSTSTVH